MMIRRWNLCCLVFLFLDKATALTSTHRRQFLSSQAAALTLGFVSSEEANAVVLDPDAVVEQTITGVRYRDDRVGQGPEVSPKEVLVMHLQGQTRDGSVIVDTRAQGPPILHLLGSGVDFVVFGGDPGKRPIVPLGVEDGIRGMRLGGVRRMVVPSPLGYGRAGVSRYDAMRMGLQNPVPRDEILRYEVELLRCVDVPSPDGSGLVSQACCTEPNYPCNTDPGNQAEQS